MIELRPFRHADAMQVLSRLDPCDHREAELVRGAATHLQIFADWAGLEGARLLSMVVATGSHGLGTPFAVLGVAHTGTAGVAQAAMLARNHGKFRLPLARAGVLIRQRMPAFARDAGIHRIEARSWSEHTSAARFLIACGFTRECQMPGFGPGGGRVFDQYAWIASDL